MSILSKKICLVGDFGVGKTSLITQFTKCQFSDRYASTIGIKISMKVVQLTTDELIQLVIWDIEGSTKSKSTVTNCFQGAKGAIIVGDATRRDSLAPLIEQAGNFLRINPESYVAIALNKSDLIHRELLEAQMQLYRSKLKPRVLAIQPTSAKTGENVDGIFQLLANRLTP